MRGILPQPHGAAQMRHLILLVEQTYHRMTAIVVDLGRVGVLQPNDIAGELDGGALADRGRCRRTESAVRGQNGSPRSCQECRDSRNRRGRECRPIPISTASAPSRSMSSASILRTMTRLDIRDAGMIECFIHRFVGIVILDIFADDGDCQLRAAG